MILLCACNLNLLYGEYYLAKVMVSPGRSGWAGLLALGSPSGDTALCTYPVYTANGIRQARHTISWLVWLLQFNPRLIGCFRCGAQKGNWWSLVRLRNMTLLSFVATLLVNAGLVRQAGGWGGGVHHRSRYLVVHVALIFSGRNSKSRSEMRPLESEMAGEIEIISNRQLLESQGAYPHIPFLNSHRKSSKCLHANLVSSDASLPRTQSCSRASKEDTGPLIVIPTASTRLLFKMPHRPCTTLQSAREVWPSRPRIVSVPMWEKFKAALQLALLQVLLSGLNLLNTFRPRLSPCPPIRLALTAIAR